MKSETTPAMYIGATNFRPWIPLSIAVALATAGCSATQKVTPAPAAPSEVEVTPVPTVPPSTPAPTVEVTPVQTPVPTRPIGRPEVKAAPGQPIGPEVTFLGAVRADGVPVDPDSVDANGVPTFVSVAGSGFMLVVEAKPGLGGYEVGRRTFVHRAGDPTLRPDLQILASRDLGNGSPEVCDKMRPNLGGVPGINPPRFADTQKVADAMNDLACRFETFLESDFSCTLDKFGNFSFVKEDTTSQFCVIVASSFAFPVGTTDVHVRMVDVEGNPGPVKRMRVRRPPSP